MRVLTAEMVLLLQLCVTSSIFCKSNLITLYIYLLFKIMYPTYNTFILDNSYFIIICTYNKLTRGKKNQTNSLASQAANKMVLIAISKKSYIQNIIAKYLSYKLICV